MGWKSGHTAWPRATMTLAPTGMPADDCSGVLVGGGGARGRVKAPSSAAPQPPPTEHWEEWPRATCWPRGTMGASVVTL